MAVTCRVTQQIFPVFTNFLFPFPENFKEQHDALKAVSSINKVPDLI